MNESTECKVREGLLKPGVRTIELENSLLTVTLLPDKGADLHQIRYKPKGDMPVLWQSPWGARPPGTMLQAGTAEEYWMDYYHGGWQLMFPNAGNDCKYKGATHGFHGEASSVPWDCRADGGDGDSAAVICETALSRSPFRLRRRFRLAAGEAVLHVEERIENVGNETMEYVWGEHIAYGAPFLDGSCILRIPGGSGAGGVVERRIPPNGSRTADMSFLEDVREGWYAVANESLQVTVGVGWDAAAFPHVWLWQEFGGSAGYPFYGYCYVMGVEPCSTPISEGLAESAARGYAFALEPGESRTTELSMVIMGGCPPVAAISKDGRVVLGNE